MPTVFHYTDEAGLAGMTVSKGKWFPSTGKNIDFNLEPFPLIQKTLILASKNFYSAAFKERDWCSPASTEFHDTTYGCRRALCWNSIWRNLQRHDVIGSGGEVNWLIDGCRGKRLPAVDLTHVDLTGGKQRPEQHGGSLC